MRNNGFAILRTAILIAPLLAACNSDSTGCTDPDPTKCQNPPGTCGAAPASCDKGKALTTDASGCFVCATLPGAAGLPSCDASAKALTADGKVLSCDDRNKGGGDTTTANKDLDSINSSIMTYNSKLDGIKASNAIYVGNTNDAGAKVKSVHNGKIDHGGGVDVGLNSANAYCADAYAGSHMCTVYEMYNTVVAGKLHMGDTIPQSWIFHPSWNRPAGDGTTPLAGNSDTCGSYTYPTADKKWKGIQVEWGVLSTGAAGFKFHGGSEAGCGSGGADLKRPIACCK